MSSLRKGYATTFLLLTLFTASFLITGCAGGDMATVTINTGIHKQASATQSSLIGRLLAFLRPGTTAYAESPSLYDPDIDILTVTITGPGMATITKDIPLDIGLVSVDVPSGPSRVFTVVAYYDYFEAVERKYGGIATRDLAPGENITIPIQMGALPPYPDGFISADGYISPAPPGVTVQWYYSSPHTGPDDIQTFIVYRSTSSSGTYIPIAILRKEDAWDGVSMYLFYDPTGRTFMGSGGNQTYYKISAANLYGRGELSYDVYANC